MPTHIEPPPNWKLREIDISKRYDVYYWEPRNRMVVYRNALFKDAANLFSSEARAGVFIELEQSNGHPVFLARQGIVQFCPHGMEITAEEIGPKQSHERKPGA